MLLLNQFFHPSTAATSQLLTDLARHLAEEGHAVTAICGRSDYAAANNEDLPNITIRRTPNLPFGRGKAARLLSYASFYGGATLLALTTRKPGAVVTLTTPPLLSVVGTLVKKLRGARHFIWEMDVYPDVAVELGVLPRDGMLTRLVGALADWSRRNADGVIALGDDMRWLLMRRGVPSRNIEVAQNWADADEITPLPFPDGPLHVLYSGNLGLAHDIRTIQSAIIISDAILGHCKVLFTFAGDGPRRAPFEAWVRARDLPNVTFRGYCPRSQLSASLGGCHIGLVTQHERLVGSVVPSKVYGIMAAGRPILYIGPPNTTPAGIIRQFNCGWHIDPGDFDSIVFLLGKLNRKRHLIYEAGARARQAFLDNFNRPEGVRRIARILENRIGSVEHSDLELANT